MTTEFLKQEELLLHSEEMDDIIGAVPGKIVRYGMIVFAIIICLCVVISFMVDYPEVVQGYCTIYMGATPKPVVSKINGQLSAMLVKDGEKVTKGQPLALIQASIGYEDFVRISDMTESIWACIQNNQWSKIYVPNIKFDVAGDLQNSYQSFYASYVQAYPFIHKSSFNTKVTIFYKDLLINDSLTHLLMEQKKMYEKDFSIAENDYRIKQLLYNENQIAASKLKQEESWLLSKKISLEELKISLMRNVSLSMEKEKEIMDLNRQSSETRTAFIQSLNKLVDDIQGWKGRYMLQSPGDGIVSLGDSVAETLEIQADVPVLYIEPQDNRCFAEIRIDQVNFGKVANNQMVIIHLPSYPFQEYGALEGKVTAISTMPNKDKQYLVKVNLNKTMITSMGNSINLVNGLDGDAEVITRKTKLFYKFFHSMQGLFQRGAHSRIKQTPDIKKSNKI